MRLPLKALNSICPMLSNELLYDTFCEYKLSFSDLLLWIWKNRKKCDEELLRLLNVENVSRALSNDSLPKAWGVALRELRALLLDNADFQRQLIAAAEGDVMMFSAVLQGALFLSSGERQSLMVKLSRVSPDTRVYPIGFDLNGSVPLLKKDNIRNDIRTGVGAERIVGQAVRAARTHLLQRLGVG